MADVKWIKITTDVFDDEKIILIESLPDAYAIITVWFKLLCLAGKQNNSGVFTMGQMPYTDKMLATIFRMKESTVTMALQTFEQFGMVEIINGVITIPNWDKHQSLDAYEKKKERDRLYQQERRQRQKLLASGKSSDSQTTQSSDVAVSDKDKEIDLDKDKKKKNNKKEKNTFGEYGNVFLSENEYENLANSFGIALRDKAIKFLDEYIEEKDYKSKSHNLAIRRWVIDAVKKAEPKQSPIAAYNREAVERMLNSDDPPKTMANDEDVRARAEALQKELAGEN